MHATMNCVKTVFFVNLLTRLTNAAAQFNLYQSDWENGDGESFPLQCDCLRVPASLKEQTDPHQFISYCLRDQPLIRVPQITTSVRPITFIELRRQNITSRHLYLWSATMDLVEQYQLYLDLLGTTTDLSALETHIFFNCTLPRFGSLCQYSLDIHRTHHTSLKEMVDGLQSVSIDRIMCERSVLCHESRLVSLVLREKIFSAHNVSTPLVRR